MTQLAERYELIERLGGGAQAVTWRARDKQTDDSVAIKQLRIAEMENWKSHELFDRETVALQNLDHPHIPDFVDAFVDVEGSDPSAFLVMEFIEGTDLSAGLVSGKTASSEELERLLTEILDVLDYLHRRQPPIVHRDIKPSNIIQRPDGSFAVVDFGAVQTWVPDAVGGSTVIGTSGYLPLEQLRGRAVPASDLYALGATLIHLASGRDPNDLEMVRGRIQFRDVCSLPENLAAALEAMLEPHVEDRVASVSDVRRVLQHGPGRSVETMLPLETTKSSPETLARHERPEDPTSLLSEEVDPIVREGALARIEQPVKAIAANHRLTEIDRPVYNPLRWFNALTIWHHASNSTVEPHLSRPFQKKLRQLGLTHVGYKTETAMYGLLRWRSAVFTNDERTLFLFARPASGRESGVGETVAGVRYYIQSVTTGGMGRITWDVSRPNTSSSAQFSSIGSAGSLATDLAEHLRWIRERAMNGDPPVLLHDAKQDCVALARYHQRHLMAPIDSFNAVVAHLVPLIVIVAVLLIALM